MPLEPDNFKIKIDDKGEVASYILNRIINSISGDYFWTSFQNPENVTPSISFG